MHKLITLVVAFIRVETGAELTRVLRQQKSMENRSKLILACMILVMLGVLGGTEMVAARSRGAALLSLCIRNYDRCFHSCYDFDAPLPPGPAEGYCWAQCDANHAACVDLAFATDSKVSRSYRKARQRLFSKQAP